MATLSEAKSKTMPLNEFLANFIKLGKKSAKDALEEFKVAKRKRK